MTLNSIVCFIKQGEKQMINFDKASIAPIKPDVIEAIRETYNICWGNPSSLHSQGRMAKKAIEESREVIAKTINAKPEQIIFTSGSTESINWFVRTHNTQNGKKFPIRITGLEHHALLNSVEDKSKYTLSKKTHRIVFVDKSGQHIMYTDDLFVEYINSEIGIINSVAALNHSRPQGRLYDMFVDASQAYGHIPIDVQKDGMDFMCTSAQKFGGPSGVGFLYVKDITDITHSTLKGIEMQRGGSQEFGVRAGTENVAGIVGMAKAAQIAYEDLQSKRRRICEIRDYFYNEITNKIPCAHLNGTSDWRYRYEGNLNFRFDGFRGEEIQSFLDGFDILVSTGSACASSDDEPSHVLRGIGLTEDEANSSIRFSFDSDNSIKEVDTIIQVLITGLEAMKR